MNNAQLLSRAARILEKSQWSRHIWAHDSNGKHCEATEPQCTGYCIMGALERAIHNDGKKHWGTEYHECTDMLTRHLFQKRLTVPKKWSKRGCGTVLDTQVTTDLVNWNNFPSRTKQEVVDALDGASRVKPEHASSGKVNTLTDTLGIRVMKPEEEINGFLDHLENKGVDMDTVGRNEDGTVIFFTDTDGEEYVWETGKLVQMTHQEAADHSNAAVYTTVNRKNGLVFDDFDAGKNRTPFTQQDADKMRARYEEAA